VKIFEQIPFPERITKPSALTLVLQERIKYMFGIIVEPIIIRHPGSFYKTRDFRYCWSMKTKCSKYEIACYEPATIMAEKKAWRVLDQISLLEYKNNGRIIGKVIY